MMKAVRNYGIEDVRVEDIPKPIPKQGEALIRILYSGICGSDLHIYKKGMFITYTPETMGHEFVGEIADPNGGSLTVGQLVVGDPRVPCLKCSACRTQGYQRCESLGFIGEVSQGCFTQYIAMPWEKLIPINRPEKLSHGALVEPLAVALHICVEAHVGKNDHVVVLGCGPIGLLTVAVAKQVFQAKTVTAVDIVDSRLQRAAQAGADFQLKDISQSSLSEFDIAVEAAGIGVTFQAGLDHLRPGGTLAMVGIFENPVSIQPNALIGKELRIIGCNTYTREDLQQAAEIIGKGTLSLDFVISRIISLDEAPEAFKALAGDHKNDLKILLQAH